jgi:TetR/AcrR family transcriptional regulator, regulator of cefoperazone and chloramphenicol sensitivity
VNVNSPKESSASVPIKQRVLRFARLLFSERGLRGTHVRDICRHAGVNVAALSYYFRGKEGLYEAIVSEAGFQLVAAAERLGKHPDDASPDVRFRSIVESLFKTLSDDHAWIARLVARQMADPAGERAGWVGLGFERHFMLLQAEINRLLGPQADREVVRLHALSVISQCLFYCLASESLPQVFLRLEGPLPAWEIMARHVASVSLEALHRESRKQDYPFAERVDESAR